jgi:hypothetical protein
MQHSQLYKQFRRKRHAKIATDITAMALFIVALALVLLTIKFI